MFKGKLSLKLLVIIVFLCVFFASGFAQDRKTEYSKEFQKNQEVADTYKTNHIYSDSLTFPRLAINIKIDLDIAFFRILSMLELFSIPWEFAEMLGEDYLGNHLEDLKKMEAKGELLHYDVVEYCLKDAFDKLKKSDGYDEKSADLLLEYYALYITCVQLYNFPDNSISIFGNKVANYSGEKEKLSAMLDVLIG